MESIKLPVTRNTRRGSLFYKLLLAFIMLSVVPAMLTGMRLLTLNQELLIASSEEWQLPASVIEEITDTLTQETIAYLTYTIMGISVVAVFASGEVLSPIIKLKGYLERFRKSQVHEQDSSVRLDPQAASFEPVVIQTGDEVEQLAVSFTQITSDLKNLEESLENMVADRTRALERQTRQLQATAAVGRAAASIRDLDELLSRTTVLISEQFNFYHAGIFLLDAKNEFAILRAANSTGGQQMLAASHRLRIGETSIVGYVARTREPRIALNVGTDAVHFKNPYLPETRSELAVPLIAGDRLWGVLDVQSKQESAFVQDDLTNLQVLADQIAIAIENANLFIENQAALSELQAALETSRKAYGELSRDAWRKLLQARSRLGYQCKKVDMTTQLVSTARQSSASAATTENIAESDISASDRAKKGSRDLRGIDESADIITPVASDWRAEMIKASRLGNTVHGEANTLAVPIKIRDHIAGVVRLQKNENAEAWSEQEIALIETISDQLAVALESARLYEDTRRRAERERLTGEIVSKVRSSNDPQVILQTAVSELRRALQASRAQAIVTEKPKNPAGSQGRQFPESQGEPQQTVDSNRDPSSK